MSPAVANHRNHAQQDAIVEKFCREHPRRPACADWRRNRHDWDEARYRRWYRDHRGDLDVNDAAAAGLFGFAAGAILGAAASQAGAAAAPAGTTVYSEIPSAGGFPAGSEGWLRYCSARYQSFDPASGTFLGDDGNRHYCR